MTRAEIATWPQGTYRFTDHIDSDGLSDDPVPLTVAVTVHKDGALTVDWETSSKQVRAAINSTLSFTKSNTFLSVRCALRGDIPNNAGVFRCIDVKVPAASVLNPVAPAPVAARALTGYRVMDTMFGALAQIVPHIIPAAGEGGNTVICLGGRLPDNQSVHSRRHDQRLLGRPSRSGRRRCDHQSLAEFYRTRRSRCWSASIRCASRTMGLCRIPAAPAASAAVSACAGPIACWPTKRSCNCAPIVCGFRPMAWPAVSLGALPEIGWARTKRCGPFPGKLTTTMRRGELLIHHQAGGGGHGDPFSRAPQAVARDVWNGKVTARCGANALWRRRGCRWRARFKSNGAIAIRKDRASARTCSGSARRPLRSVPWSDAESGSAAQSGRCRRSR